ncbi:MAG: TonB-dependent receptor [Pseudomonadota bacterium]
MCRHSAVPVFLAAVVAAAAVRAEPLEEIVVRADLRDRAVSELPTSITVLDSATIDATAIAHFEELAHVVPNLNFAGGSNRPRYFQIRGTGERSQYEGAPNPSVGFIVDDMDFSAIGGVALTWDIDQVEVLRGPQGTRYGANALAGLIHVTSTAPSATPSLKLRALGGGDDARGYGIAGGGALGRRSAARISAWHYRANGFRDNAFLGVDDSNGRDESDLRLRYRYQGERLTVDATALYVDVDNGYDAFAIDNGFTVYSDRPGRDTQRSLGGSLKLRAAAAPFDIVSITSAVRSDIRFDFDADWGNDEFWAPYTYDFVSTRRRIRETASQEVRLVSQDAGRIDWVAGLYALNLREDLIARDAGVYVDPAFGAFLSNTLLGSDYESTSLAAFGEIDIALGAAASLAVGVRVERRRADYADTAGIAVDPAETMFGGHVTLSREFAGWFGYASYSRGYKAGGFNLGRVPDGRREFDAEFVDNFELGARRRWLDGSIDAALTLFHAERDEQQVATSAQLVAGDPSSFVFFVDNAAAGSHSGLELDANWYLTSDLRASLGLGLLTSDVDAPGNAVLSGRDQAHAPPYTFALGLSYEPPDGLYARLGVTGKDRFYFSNGHNERSSAYALLNARVGYRRGPWDVNLWGRNLSDRRYAVRGFFFENEPPDFVAERYVRLGDRRQVGITVNWSLQ